MNEITKVWVSAYLYYWDSLDIFLKNAVLPCVEKLREKNAFEQFFFIRYFERGRHIRLRFKTDLTTANEVIKPFIVEFFNNYFEKYPSTRYEPEWVKNLPDEQKWLPNNFIQFIEYEVEEERYGGPRGLEISEEQFYLCSETILKAIGESTEWNYNKSMGLAIQLMVSFCYSAGFSHKEMIDVFYSYYTLQLFMSINKYFSLKENERMEDYREKMLIIFEDNFNKRKDYYVKLHQNLLDSLSDNIEFEEKWFCYWIEKNRIIMEKLKYAQEENRLIIPNNLIKNFFPNCNGNYKLFFIMYSYIHMTFNRLGIENKDEPYISYIIVESIKNLKK